MTPAEVIAIWRETVKYGGADDVMSRKHVAALVWGREQAILAGTWECGDCDHKRNMHQDGLLWKEYGCKCREYRPLEFTT